VAHLNASYVLELLENLQDNSAWKTKGLVVGSPAFQLSSNSANTPSTKVGGELVLKNQIELTPDQAQTLFEFLSAQEGSLKRISLYDKEDAKLALNKVFRLIATYGRKVRKRKGTTEQIENREPKVIPTSIPRGSYFTVYQAAQVCQVTSKQIRAWIRKGKLEALDLPGLGILIEAGKLNEFLGSEKFGVKLVTAMNPCSYGHWGAIQKACGCAPAFVSKHQKRISGPLLYRMIFMLKFHVWFMKS
jgi:hypothetical protein